MAIFRTGLINAISGNLGSVNFVHRTGSLVVRRKRSSADRTSTSQLRQRAATAKIALAWSDLTDDERNQWRTAARTYPATSRIGQTRAIRGFQLFMKYNLIRWLYDRTLNDTPPSPLVIEPNFSTQWDVIVAGTYAWSGRNFGDEDNTSVLLYGAVIYQPTVPLWQVPVRFFGSVAYSDVSQDLKTKWLSALPSPQVGQTAVLASRAIRTNPDLAKGAISPMTWTSAIAT